MCTKHGAFGSFAGYKSHLLRSPFPWDKSRCFGRCWRSVCEAAANSSVFLRAFSGPTCSTLLYARLRASSDIVIQSMVGHSFAPRVVGVAMPATVSASELAPRKSAVWQYLTAKAPTRDAGHTL